MLTLGWRVTFAAVHELALHFDTIFAPARAFDAHWCPVCPWHTNTSPTTERHTLGWRVQKLDTGAMRMPFPCNLHHVGVTFARQRTAGGRKLHRRHVGALFLHRKSAGVKKYTGGVLPGITRRLLLLFDFS